MEVFNNKLFSFVLDDKQLSEISKISKELLRLVVKIN